MTRPRVRFTVRRMMVAVALAGILSGGAAWCLKMYRLSRHYSRISNYYEGRYDAQPGSPPRVREWEGAMMGKYRFLTLCPWGTVEPDPPEPR